MTQSWSSLDADGCQGSGSVSLPVGGQGIQYQATLSQVTSNVKYIIGAKYFGSDPYCLGNFYSDQACQNSTLSPAYIGTSVTSPASSSSWGTISGSWPTDTGTQCILVQCQGSGSYIDQIYLNAVTETGF
jgi:hypothetical protein